MQRYFTAFNNKRNILNKFTDLKKPTCFMFDVAFFFYFIPYFHKKRPKECNLNQSPFKIILTFPP